MTCRRDSPSRWTAAPWWATMPPTSPRPARSTTRRASTSASRAGGSTPCSCVPRCPASSTSTARWCRWRAAAAPATTTTSCSTSCHAGASSGSRCRIWSPTTSTCPAAPRTRRSCSALTGLDQYDLVATDKHRAVSADHLLVPSMPNPFEVAPTWMVEWIRHALPPVHTDDKPRPALRHAWLGPEHAAARGRGGALAPARAARVRPHRSRHAVGARPDRPLRRCGRRGRPARRGPHQPGVPQARGAGAQPLRAGLREALLLGDLRRHPGRDLPLPRGPGPCTAADEQDHAGHPSSTPRHWTPPWTASWPPESRWRLWPRR